MKSNSNRGRYGTGSITERTLASGKLVYDVSYWYIDPSGQRRHTTRRGKATKREAQTALNDAMSSSSAGQHTAPGRETVRGAVERFIDARQGREHSAATTNSYKTKARLHVYPHIGKRSVKTILPSDLDKMYRKLESEGSKGGNGPLAPATVRQIHDMLSGAFSQCVRDRLISMNPCAAAHPPTGKAVKAAGREKIKTWTGGQVGSFLAETGSDRLGALWHFLFTTGVRRGEALGLRWSDVELEAGTARLVQTVGTIRGRTVRNATTKGGDPRVIHLDAVTVGVLRGYKRSQAAERLAHDGDWRDEGLVFCRSTNRLDLGGTPGSPLNGDRVSASFNAAIKRVSAKLAKQQKSPLPLIRLHDTRHTWATLALRAGVSVKVVQERLGHAHPSITMGIYAHVQPGMDKDAAETVARLF